MTDVIEQIEQEIDTTPTPEMIEVSYDPDSGKLVEFHRDTFDEMV